MYFTSTSLIEFHPTRSHFSLQSELELGVPQGEWSWIWVSWTLLISCLFKYINWLQYGSPLTANIVVNFLYLEYLCSLPYLLINLSYLIQYSNRSLLTGKSFSLISFLCQYSNGNHGVSMLTALPVNKPFILDSRKQWVSLWVSSHSQIL